MRTHDPSQPPHYTFIVAWEDPLIDPCPARLQDLMHGCIHLLTPYCELHGIPLYRLKDQRAFMNKKEKSPPIVAALEARATLASVFGSSPLNPISPTYLWN